MDVQAGRPRQGPGCDACTLEALAVCSGLPREPRILDVGCGPGMQTLALARATGGHATAVDLFPAFLDQLAGNVDAAGLSHRITRVQADMRRLDFPPDHFDLVWSEGAAYIMGFANALAAWRPLLVPGGYLAATELVWLVPDPPSEVARFFHAGYPPMSDVETRLADFHHAGYDVVHHFTLPDAAWWDAYYTPAQARMPELRARYANDPFALEVVAEGELEIEMRRRHPDAYGYEFIVARKPA